MCLKNFTWKDKVFTVVYLLVYFEEEREGGQEKKKLQKHKKGTAVSKKVIC